MCMGVQCVWLCEIRDVLAKRSKEGKREIFNLRAELWYCNELFAGRGFCKE